MPLSHLRKRGGKLLNLFFRSERVSVSVGDEEQATPKIVSPRSEPGIGSGSKQQLLAADPGTK